MEVFLKKPSAVSQGYSPSSSQGHGPAEHSFTATALIDIPFRLWQPEIWAESRKAQFAD